MDLTHQTREHPPRVPSPLRERVKVKVKRPHANSAKARNPNSPLSLEGEG